MKTLALLTICALTAGCNQPACDDKATADRLEKLRAEEKADAQKRAEAVAAAARQRTKERQAIVAALKSLDELGRRDVRTVKGGRQASDVPRLIADMDQMNLAGCPEKFRLAMFDLVTALKIQQKQNKDLVIDVLADIGSMAFPATTATAAAKTMEDLQIALKADPELASRAVVRVLIEYDLK